MIIHTALYKWKTETTQEQISQALKGVQELKNKVDGIQDIFAGENYHKEAKGFTYGIVVVAQNQESLDAYRNHPDHAIVAGLIEKMEEDGLGFDFKNLE